MGRHRKRKEAVQHLKQRREKRRAHHPNERPPGPRQGRVQKNPRGFAFILTGVPGGDYYVPPEEARMLLNDDIVEYSVVRDRGRPYAEIKKIVRRTQTDVVGRLRYQDDRLFLISMEGDAHAVIDPPEAVNADDWAFAKFEKYPTRNHAAQVKLIDVLGPELTPLHDITLTCARHGLPREFSPEALEEAFLAKITARKAIQELGERVDLRQFPLVTIDGADAKDFDDAVCVLRNVGDSPFVLYVAIADVSHFVTEGSGLDSDARARGTSVYFPGTAIPMLPEGLSNELCSLMPRVDRLAFTAEIHLDREGKIQTSRFYKSLIRTAARLTYEEVQLFFDKPDAADSVTTTLAEPLRSLRALYRLMAKRRLERGTMDFELPESQIVVDTAGNPTECAIRQRFEAHKLIEEFMIAANSEVARACHRFPTLFRVHEAPALGAMEEVNQMMRHLGISRRMTELTPKAFAEILEATRGVKGSATLHQAILRLMKQAKYEAEPKGHFGLALEHYTHFTSPIRRYPDLVVHRQLKKLLELGGVIEKGKKSDKEEEERTSLTAVGLRMSELERRAMEAERFIVKRKQCWFMRERLGETFQGIIGGVTVKGIFVQIETHGIEGFVPVDSMGGFFEFDENRQCLRERPGHQTLSVGDAYAIVVDQVSLEDHQITFAPA